MGDRKRIGIMIGCQGALLLTPADFSQIIHIDNDRPADSEKLFLMEELFNLADILRNSIHALIDEKKVSVIGFGLTV